MVGAFLFDATEASGGLQEGGVKRLARSRDWLYHLCREPSLMPLPSPFN
jgi:hypothetical protein